MRVTCHRERLLSAFQTCATVAPARSPKPILRNVKLVVGESGATLLATDLELGIRMDVPDMDVQSPGAAVLPLDRFGSILRESSDERLRLESDGKSIVVRGERSEFRLPAENPDEYPAVAEFSESRYHELPARLARELIRRTIFATDAESNRYALGGVLLEFLPNQIVAVGTDGRRLAKMEVPATATGGGAGSDAMTIVPAKAMQLIDRTLGDGDEVIRVTSRNNELLVKTPRSTVYARLLEGRFPRWRDVFPNRAAAARLELTVGQLHAAVRQAMIVTNEESRGVDFAFSKGNLVLTGQAAEMGESHVELPVAYDGENIGIKLDPRFVADFLKALDPEKTFTIDIKDAESAAVCSTDDGYGYVIMPLARDR